MHPRKSVLLLFSRCLTDALFLASNFDCSQINVHALLKSIESLKCTWSYDRVWNFELLHNRLTSEFQELLAFLIRPPQNGELKPSWHLIKKSPVFYLTFIRFSKCFPLCVLSSLRTEELFSWSHTPSSTLFPFSQDFNPFRLSVICCAAL